MLKKFDFVIVGSGFAGSLTSMALVQSGFSVCMVEKKSHPRFAIGESSTPIADMILRDLAKKYNMPFLTKISRYGEWQRNYPEVLCGLKRGFSYYFHKKGEFFTSDDHHSNELLLAASKNNENSDTNWLRSDVDHFLVKKAVDLDVDYMENTVVKELVRDVQNETWDIKLESAGKTGKVQSDWIIDATGSSNFSEKYFGTRSTSEGFETNSMAVYSHLNGVDRWLETLEEKDYKTSDYPYNPDYSALHHLIEEGWCWMLRFRNNRTSAGILLDNHTSGKWQNLSATEIWKSVIQEYPSLTELFESSSLADMPGKFIRTGRLQHRLNKLYGDGWVAMPYSGGFVDPLHSTGIAHSLTGVEKILATFTNDTGSKKILPSLESYQIDIFNELEIIDLIVSCGYLTRRNFKLFTAASMLYFIATIHYEQTRMKGVIPGTFLCVDNAEIREIVQNTHSELKQMDIDSLTEKEAEDYVGKIRKRIEPFNTAGLMNSENRNMYEHTAVIL